MTSMAEDLKKKSSIDIPNAAIDKPDVRDWIYSAIAGSDKKPIQDVQRIPVQNQSLSPYTKMACGSYATAHALNRGNIMDD
jgi:hypothetical protein